MIQVRRANLKDVTSLVRFRIALFKEMEWLKGEQEEEEIFGKACEHYFNQFMTNEEFKSWVAENNEEVVAVSGLVFFQKPPSPGNNSGKEAYIMNMYTLPKWRKKGIASKLFEEIINYLKQKGITSISLHASKVAKSVYEKFGFTLTENEMKLKLEYNE